MKTILFSLIFATGLSVIASNNKPTIQECALKAEQYVTMGYSNPGELISTENDQLVYRVMTNQNGGDAAMLVTVNSHDCSLISFETLWSE